VQRFFLRQKQPPERAVANMLKWLATGNGEARAAVAQRWQEVIKADLASLAPTPDATPHATASLGLDLRRLYRTRQERAQRRLSQLLEYTTGSACRATILLHPFQATNHPCKACDRCKPGLS
jgi:hypothetical protein